MMFISLKMSGFVNPDKLRIGTRAVSPVSNQSQSSGVENDS